ncbi:MAG TPA: hypothetical protein VMP01_18120 [Pirellulaceae bacterium]|nr:hypothetical protein [Pirellulaceae bacterium]
MAATTNWSEADTQRAIDIWTQYLAAHDVSDRVGQTAGIEPDSGRVWFGSSAQDIARQMEAAGGRHPFYAVRVGGEHYVRKGGRR